MTCAPPVLDTRLTLEAPIATPDGGGGTAVVWTEKAVHWARIEPLSGREKAVGGRSAARVSHRIRLRRPLDPGLRPTAAERLVGAGRTFAIRAVGEGGPRDLYLTVWAEEGPLS